MMPFLEEVPKAQFQDANVAKPQGDTKKKQMSPTAPNPK